MKTQFTRIRAFLRDLSWPIALHAAAAIAIAIGIAAVVSFLWNSPWFARIGAALFLAAAWRTLYALEFYYRTRRTLGAQ
jgi:hypothetical protein